VSKNQKGDDFTISVTRALPAHVSQAEIRLIKAHLGELLQRIIRETDQED
jgi:hypothetical protein